MKNPTLVYNNYEDALFSDLITHLYAVLHHGGKIQHLNNRRSCTHNSKEYFTWSTDSKLTCHINSLSVKMTPDRLRLLEHIEQAFQK
jgi:hypothetical protein